MLDAADWKEKTHFVSLFKQQSLEGERRQERPTVANTSKATRWTEKGDSLLVLYTVPRKKKEAGNTQDEVLGAR